MSELKDAYEKTGDPMVGKTDPKSDMDAVVERLQKELKAADARQELFTSNDMSEDDKFEFQRLEGRMEILQELLLDWLGGSVGI